MNNNMLIEKRQGIIHKIIDFFKNMFSKKQKSIEARDSNINSTENIKDSNITNTEKKTEMSKNEFLELYERAKKNEVDLLSLDTDTLEKICKLIQEEIKIVERANLKIEQEIKEIRAMLDN